MIEQLQNRQLILIGLNLLIIIILSPIGEAIRDMSNNGFQKYLGIVRDLFFLFIILIISRDMKFSIFLGLSYVFLLAALQNIIYNFTRGLPLHYSATTTVIGWIETKVQAKYLRKGVYLGRFLLLGIGVLLFWLGVR